MLLPLRDSVAVGHSGIRVDLLPMSVGAAQLRRQRRIIRAGVSGLRTVRPLRLCGPARLRDLRSGVVGMNGAALPSRGRQIGGVEGAAVSVTAPPTFSPLQVQIAQGAYAHLRAEGTRRPVKAGKLSVGVQDGIVHAHPRHGVGALQGVAAAQKEGRSSGNT